MFDTDDTIVAIASAAGPATRGIVRLSGNDAVSIVKRVFTPFEGWPDSIPRATVIEGRIAVDDVEIQAAVLLWPDTRSYTRQPSAEFHLVGAKPVLQMVVDAVCLAGGRLAEAGEFTLRAFLSGRLDLTQAEAVLAVIDAESDTQFDTALQQLAGGLAGPLGELRERLLSVLAELEAGLDFVEEDIEFISQGQLLADLTNSHQKLAHVIEQISARDVTADLPTVVFVGKPNSGKSSLFNVLSQTDRAIVTDVAGTTTDFISQRVELGQGGQQALAVVLVDTAGEESATGEISAEAQLHRAAQSRQADLRLLCFAATEFCPIAAEVEQKLPSGWSDQHLDQIRLLESHDIILITKCDLVATGSSSTRLTSESMESFSDRLRCSLRASGIENPVAFCSSAAEEVAMIGLGIQGLIEAIRSSLTAGVGESVSVVGSTVQRATESLRLAEQAMAAALQATEHQLGEEIVAAEIREALNALGLVVGVVYTDDILDLVFGRFCIGK